MPGFSDLVRAAAAAQAARPSVPLALATLVEVEGSSYRQPGARLLVDAEGRVLAGAISGGCLEGDVAARAADVCASGTPVQLRYDLRNDLETIWGFGSACDGIATIVLEPVAADGWLAEAEGCRAGRETVSIATAYREHGADAGEIGTVALIPGAEVRALGDGPLPPALADRIRRTAESASRTGRAQAHVEAGAPKLLVAPLLPPIALHLVGAGRGAEAFARIGHALGWTVTVTDHRPALLEALTLPPGTRVRHGSADGAADLPADRRTAVALLTHIFDADLAWLAAFAARPVGYVGILGSRQRAALLLDALASHGAALTPAQRARIHAPIGLDLGGETPESIALAAVAEIEAVMHGRPGGSLRERQSPIHERTPVPAPLPNAGAASGRAVPETIVPTECRLDLPADAG